MHELVLDLQTIKSEEGATIAEHVRRAADELGDRAESVLDAIAVRNSALMRDRSDFDRSRVLETALLAIVLSSVSVINPYARKQGVQRVSAACELLGVRYDDVLALTEAEGKILEAIG